MNTCEIVLTAVASAVLVWFLFFTALFFLILRRKQDKDFDDGVELKGTHYEPYISPLMAAIANMRSLPYREVSVTSDDGLKLYGRYFYFGYKKTAIMVHGYRSTPYNNFSVIGGRLVGKGYNVLFIDQRCHGKSEGRLLKMGQKEQYDVLRWADYVAQDKEVESILIYGTSMGATTVGYMSDKKINPKVKALTMDCGFVSFYRLLWFLIDNPRGIWLCLGLPVFVFWGWIFGIKLFASTEKSVENTKLPVCFIHGKKDESVPFGHTELNYKACRTEKKLILVEQAGHTASLLVGGEKSISEFLKFVEKYMN